MELVQGSVLERATRLEIGSGLLLTQNADGIAKIDWNPAVAITQEYADTHYVLKAGDTMSGDLYVPHAFADQYMQAGTGTNGYIRLTQGDGAHTGYIEWYRPGGVRNGYFGYGLTNVRLQLENAVFEVGNTAFATISQGGEITATHFVNAVGNTNPYFGLNDGSNQAYLQIAGGTLQLHHAGIVRINMPVAGEVNFETEIRKNAGAGSYNYYYGWGADVIGAGGVDNYGGNAPFIFNHHTGFTFTSHDAYGGIRFYAQNYPTMWPAAALIARFMGSGITLGSTVSLTAVVPSALVFSGSPTNVMQMQMGTSSVAGAFGSEFSSGYEFISHNALQYASLGDAWSQSYPLLKSTLFEVTTDGVAMYIAPAGAAPNSRAGFWGAAVFAVAASGNVNTVGYYYGTTNRGLRIGNSFFGQQGSGYGEVGYNNSDGAGTQNYFVSDFASRIRFNSGGLSFQTAPSGTAGGAITFTERMIITQSGAVSLGGSLASVVAGEMSVPNNHAYRSSNAANTATYALIYLDSIDRVVVDGNGRSVVFGAGFTAQGAAIFSSTVTFSSTVNMGSGAWSGTGAITLTGNSFFTNNWFRSTGNTGWFSSDYATGIYSIATGVVRTYNGGAFFSESYIRTNSYFYADQNYGCGLIGLYDPSHYQMIYAMGDTYKLPIAGTTSTGFYGMAWVYDYPGYLNLSGHNIEHALAIFAAGTVRSIMGMNGIWTGGQIWAVSNMNAADFVLTSDARLKGDVVPITDALDRVAKLSGFGFNFHGQTRRRVGVSAQEVMAVLPEAVYVQPDGTLGVAYDALVPLLIEAVKELRLKVAA